MLKHAGRKQFDGKNKDFIIQKLEQAFSLGCTDEEAYIYAGISKSAFYAYQHKHPEFLERKHILQQGLILQARQTLVKALATDYKIAMWYLSKKLPWEFGVGVKRSSAPLRKINFLEEAEKRTEKYGRTR